TASAGAGEEKKIRSDVVGVDKISPRIDSSLYLMVSFGVRDAVHVVVDVNCPFKLGVASQRIGSSVEAVVQERLQKSHQRLLQRSARVDRDLRLAEAVVSGPEFVDDVLPKVSRKRQSDIGSKTICRLTETRKIRHAGCFCSKGIDDMRDVRAVTSRQ